MPHWGGKVFEGDSRTQSIVRSSTEAVECKSPDFDQYMCLSAEDFQSLIDGFMHNQCK